MNLTHPAEPDTLTLLSPPQTLTLTQTNLFYLTLLLLLPACHLIYKDYSAFLDLGPGGTPPTVPGYLRVCLLRLFALKDPYTPMPIPTYLRPSSGHLHGLPKRAGPRPHVAGIAPHRQTSQKSPEATFAKLSQAIAKMADLHPDRLAVGISCFETHGMGLFSKTQLNRTCRGEICHAHAIDGSLHMTLHPADAKLVLERGWGERHPLAKGGWWTRFVPKTFLMVYAPRDEVELRVVLEVVRAATWWVSGQSLWEGGDGGGEKSGMGVVCRTLADSHGMLQGRGAE